MDLQKKIEYIATQNGLDTALEKLHEECSEFTTAWIHFQSRGDDWVEELADVMILVKQIEFLLNKPENESNRYLRKCVQEEMERKADRQMKRIQEVRMKRLEVE